MQDHNQLELNHLEQVISGKRPNGKKQDREENLPAIPDKRYFSIGEVSCLCLVKPHVLRYWEQEFPQLNPSKRRGSRRYYQRLDILLIRKIRDLLYAQGFTIEGARSKLSESKKGKSSVVGNFVALIQDAVSQLKKIVEDLERG